MLNLRIKAGLMLLTAISLVAFWSTRVRNASRSHQISAVQNKNLASDFSLTQLDGQQLRLADYRGKVVLLNFWATWCAPCRSEIPQFIDWQNKFGADGLQVIGISMDDGPEPIRNFSKEFKINYPVALGNPELAESYGGVLGLPVNIVIDRKGEVKSRQLGVADIQKLEQELRNQLAAK